MRVLELFAGIGGAACAVEGRASVIAAVDQDEAASLAYAHLHGEPTLRHNLHHAKPAWFARFEADLWWMSPPCQPYTIRGRQRDLDDPRAQALQRVVAAVEALQPAHLALENVPWFSGSRSEALLLRTLEACGYEVARTLLCPTSLGIPAQRRRYYLVASRHGLRDAPDVWPDADPDLEPPSAPRVATIADWVGPFREDHAVPDELAARYEGALHIVDADDPDAVAVCFTGAYGRSPVHAGSYLRQDGRVRWWTAEEIGRSLGLPDGFSLPEGLSREKRYKLVGNSLSVVAARHVLGRIPGLLA